MLRRALLLLLIAAPAAGAAPRASVETVPLPRDGVVRVERGVQAVGLTWRGGGEVHASVRAGSGRWTELSALDAARGTAPAWVGGARTLRFRVDSRPPGLRVRLVRARVDPRRARAAQRTGGTPATRAQAGAPPIVPRSAWAGEACTPKRAPSLGEVQAATVHHTATAADYRPEDAGAAILAICRYHRDTQGWDDLGYNFVVDRYGQVFEGRAGGVDQAVIGAHAAGYNRLTTGVAVLGSYQRQPLDEAGVQALARLIAWKLPLHGTPTQGTVTLESGGGQGNRYPRGSQVTVERIDAHRDTHTTECPGEQLFAQLPRVRELVAASAPPPRTPTLLELLPVAPVVTFPAPLEVGGRVTLADGRPLAGAPVEVQVRGRRSWVTVATPLTAADGTFRARSDSTASRRVRARYAGDGGTAPSSSDEVTVAVAPRLTARRVRSRIRAGRSGAVRGTLEPRGGGLVVRVERQQRGRWVRIAKRPVRVRGGRYRAALKLSRPALYRFRVVFTGDEKNAATESAALYIRATR